MSGLGEFQLIDWIRQRASQHPQVPVGIGDDAAILLPSPREEVIVTTDMLMDGRHFVVGQCSPELIGRKALAVNLSDMAAMAGRPLAAFVSWALPRHGGRTLAQSLFAGMSELAEEFDVAIAGGDTNSWDGPLVISVTLVGETVGRRRMLRNGARPGDGVYITGPVGGSLRSGRHLTFTPRVREALDLVRHVPVSAMLDLSDGIASDLRHILQESGVGATLEGDAIPIHCDVDPTLPPTERLRRALTDGEDFELLWTASPDQLVPLGEYSPGGWKPVRIGTIDEVSGCRLRTAGHVTELPIGGWEHVID